jgi:ABC-type multidrug transport system ATPase subunit
MQDDSSPHDLKRTTSTVRENTSVQWKDLSVTIPKRRGKSVTILHPTTGLLNAGDMLAVMGPSGSGKTTLLDALSGRIKEHKVKGTVHFNGRSDVSYAQRSRLLSYVPQEDSLLGAFTVAESLRFARRFYHGYSGGGGTAELEAQALALVGLESVADVVVGDIFRKGLSGGQKRRLSLAVELIKQPAVLVLDEPTSGLDSASAFGVMQRLRAMAKAGHALVCTIHQPSSEVWGLFDGLLLLSLGHTVYYGKAEGTVGYLSACGHTCPTYSNPADFALALVNADFDDAYDASLVDKYASSAARAATQQAVAKVVAAGQGSVLGGTSDYALKPLSTFATLCHRFTLNNMRNPGIYWVRLVMYVMLCLMIGLMYIGLGDEYDYSSINSRTSMLFYIAAFLGFMSVAVLPFFMMERPVFLRERGNGAYGVLAWVFANLVCSVPGLALISILSTVCVVPLAGLNGFGVFFAALFCSLLAAEGFMCLVGAIVPHYIIGIALGAGVYGFFMLCEGAFKVYDDIPPWFIWVHYIGFHTYSYRVFMYNEFEPIAAFDDGAPFASGAELLDFYSFSNVNVGRDLAALVGFGLFFHACFATVLYFFHTGRR